MSSRLKEAIMSRDQKSVKQIMSSHEQHENWSLTTIIDELLPLMLMESNLRYGSFHIPKMSLFLRRLTIEGYFSETTQLELGCIIALEMVKKEWVSIYGDRIGYIESDASPSPDRIIEELDKGNVHNAFYYGIGLLEKKPEILVQTLLTLGSSSIAETLGHSLTCFFPVMKDVMIAGHPQADSALLSYIMYLSRFDAPGEVLKKGYGRAEDSVDYDMVLKLCASGDGIVNLHHMITFCIFKDWEHATFNEYRAIPYGILLDWLGEKKLDKDRERRAAHSKYRGKPPDSYEEFSHQFSFRTLHDSMPFLFQVLEDRPKMAVDWIFRLYASHYNQVNWDFHYYTSLYSALRLYIGDAVRKKIACRTALEQALCYFAKDMI